MKTEEMESRRKLKEKLGKTRRRIVFVEAKANRLRRRSRWSMRTRGRVRTASAIARELREQVEWIGEQSKRNPGEWM